MTYTILFLEHERVMASTSWDTGLEAAKKYACENLEKRAVELVEVWDESDALVFRHPVALQSVRRRDPMA